MYILTAEDQFTRWPIAIPIKDKAAETIAQELDSKVIAEHGVMQELLTDNAPELTGYIIKDVAELLHIKKVETIPYNPDGNKVEHFHRTLAAMLRTVVGSQHNTWNKYLPAILLAYRTSVHNITKFTPFFLTHGREARLPVDIVFNRPPQQQPLHTTYGVELRQRLEEAFGFVRDNCNKVIRRRAGLFTGTLEGKDLQIGDLVWYYSTRPQEKSAKKLHQGWLGPFKIDKLISDCIIAITPEGQWTKVRQVSIPVPVHRIKRYYPDTAKLITGFENIAEKEFIQHVVDEEDEFLEATGPISIPTNSPEQTPNTTVRVTYPEEEVEMVDVGTPTMREGIRNDDQVQPQKRKRGRPPNKNKSTNEHVALNDYTKTSMENTQVKVQSPDTCSPEMHQDEKQELLDKNRNSQTEQQQLVAPSHGRSTRQRTGPSYRLPFALENAAVGIQPSPSTKRKVEEDQTENRNKIGKQEENRGEKRKNNSTLETPANKESKIEESDIDNISDQLANLSGIGIMSLTSRGGTRYPDHLVVTCEGTKVPEKKTAKDVGMDVFCTDPVYIPPGETRPVGVGLHIRPAQGTWIQLEEVSNFVIMRPNLILRGKVIDPSYTGEVKCLFTNIGEASKGHIYRGERVAQLVTRPFREAPCLHVQKLPRTKRGASAGWARALEEVFAISDDESKDEDDESVRGSTSKLSNEEEG